MMCPHSGRHLLCRPFRRGRRTLCNSGGLLPLCKFTLGHLFLLLNTNQVIIVLLICYTSTQQHATVQCHGSNLLNIHTHTMPAQGGVNSLVGVAIAASLLPPVVNVGMCLAFALVGDDGRNDAQTYFDIAGACMECWL
mgnify:CR=1 FL=1